MATLDELYREAYSHWSDTEVLFRTGRELQDRTRLDHAARILRRSVELEPEHEEAWSYLSFAHYRRFDEAGGSAVLREGIEATGSDVLRATLAGFTSDEEERDALWKAVEGNDSPEVRAARAAQRYYGGEEEAFRELRDLQAEHPENEDVRDTLLWSCMHAKMTDPGLDLHEWAVPLADEKIARSPDRIAGHWLKLQLLLAEKDWDGVLEETARALRRHPDEETLTQMRGRAFREKGDPDRAIGCFHRAIGMKPSYVGARVELGKTYEAADRMDLAEEIFREIPVANPDYAAGPVSLSLFLARRERWEEAEDLFVTAWPTLPPWVKGGLSRNEDAKRLMERDAVKAVVEKE